MKRSFLFPEGYGEYTSWYMERGFVSQSGVETASMRPQGKTCHDDFFSMMKGTQIALQKTDINNVGAEMRLIVGIDNVRRLWKVDPKKMEPVLNVSEDVRFLSEGGFNPWNSGFCHIEESTIRLNHFARTEEDRDYVYKALNPDSPFIGFLPEEVNYSVDTGTLVINNVETPRNVFTFLKRKNRSINGEIGKKKTRLEAAYKEALDILNHVDPTTLIQTPSTTQSMADYCVQMLQAQSADLELTGDERMKYLRAIEMLQASPGDCNDDHEILGITENFEFA